MPVESSTTVPSSSTSTGTLPMGETATNCGERLARSMGTDSTARPFSARTMLTFRAKGDWLVR
jgi:hypothetical protein